MLLHGQVHYIDLYSSNSLSDAHAHVRLLVYSPIELCVRMRKWKEKKSSQSDRWQKVHTTKWISLCKSCLFWIFWNFLVQKSQSFSSVIHFNIIIWRIMYAHLKIVIKNLWKTLYIPRQNIIGVRRYETKELLIQLTYFTFLVVLTAIQLLIFHDKYTQQFVWKKTLLIFMETFLILFIVLINIDIISYVFYISKVSSMHWI